MKQKVVFLIGTRWFGVLGPCSQIIEELSSEGIKVVVFGQADEHYHRYYKHNCELIAIKMRRSYFALISDVFDVAKIIRLAWLYRPIAVHSFNPKPALLSFASILWFRETKFFIGVTGLGNTFIRAPKLSKLIAWALRKACARSSFVFFQNEDDIEMFKAKKLVAEEKMLKFTGPGVDLNTFFPKVKNSELEEKRKIKVGCTARLIWQKGIKEYLTAAERVMEDPTHDFEIEFYLYGEIDAEHPDCVDPAYIKSMVDKGVVIHVSWTDDIAMAVRDLDIFVLHSYREGAPRAILEASASGLPTIGSDAIGVRELVIDGVTGYLTPLHDVDALIEKIILLANNSELRQKMGREARTRIGEKYSLTNASRSQLRMYELTNVI